MVVQVPTRALLTALSIPKDFRRRHKSISVHGLVASYLAFGDSSKYDHWKATWPSKKDFEETMPIQWPEIYKNSLPPAMKSSLLDVQQKKFAKDFNAVKIAVPDASLSEYLYNWLVVNTRSFYFEQSDTKLPSSRDDRMVCISKTSKMSVGVAKFLGTLSLY